jgi:uncharacterized membrane protein YsdA (DUF1294 family)
VPLRLNISIQNFTFSLSVTWRTAYKKTIFMVIHLKPVSQWLLAWVAVTSAWAFLLFGFDKWRAGRTGRRRVAESSLCLVSALGGWPGGLLGIVVFRHKSSKPSFLFKFILALVVWAALVAGAWKILVMAKG